VLIRVEDVTKRFDGGGEPVEAVSELGLSVADGEFLSVVGPSGCGKTTLLKLIAGLTAPTDGAVYVGGDRVTEPDPAVGMVFQEFSLFPWRTVRENIGFGLELMGTEPSERAERVAQLIDLTGLSGFGDAYPEALSGGMQKRVALARTLAADPVVMLMDEPFGALDEQTRLLMGEELLRIWEEDQKTVLFVTHSLQEAVLLSDRVAVMSGQPGRIKQVVDVPLDRPRTSDAVEMDAFQDVQSEIWQSVKTESEDMLRAND